MKHLIISILLAIGLTFASCAPDLPITADEVTDLREKLDVCLGNMDELQSILEELLEELQTYLDGS